MNEENNRLHNFLHNILQTLKKFFHRLLKIGTEKDKDKVYEILKKGSEEARKIAGQTLKEVKTAMGINYFDN